MRVLGSLAMIAALAGAAFPSAAQTPQHAGPEWTGIVEARVRGVIRELERQRMAETARMKGLGLGDVRVGYEFRQARSPVRFQTGEPVEFVIRVSSQAMDPRSFVRFSRLTPKKNRRVLATMTVGWVSGGNTGHLYDVPFVARRQGTQFFRITPSTPLAPGEYMLTSNSTEAYLFGVD